MTSVSYATTDPIMVPGAEYKGRSNEEGRATGGVLKSNIKTDTLQVNEETWSTAVILKTNGLKTESI